MRKIYFVVCIWMSFFSDIQALQAQQNEKISSGTVISSEKKENTTSGDPLSNRVFEFSLKKDLPILAGSGAMAVTGMYLMAQVPPLTEAEIALLDPSAINAFDRAATRQYRYQDANLSDHLLTLSALTPFSLLASRSVRRELAPIVVMYFETAALAGGLTSISKGLFKRKRPYAYNPNAPMADKLSVGTRHSYFSGHVSSSASFCFLTAYMVSRYAERPGWKWAAWSGAVVIPGTIGLWRYTSGKHFPTDIITGYIIGAGTGILIPFIHKAQLPEDVSLNIQPLPNGVVMTLTF